MSILALESKDLPAYSERDKTDISFKVVKAGLASKRNPLLLLLK